MGSLKIMLQQTQTIYLLLILQQQKIRETNPEVIFRYWNVNRTSNQPLIKIFEIEPYLHQTAGFVVTESLSKYYQSITELYKLFGDRKKIYLKELKKAQWQLYTKNIF